MSESEEEEFSSEEEFSEEEDEDEEGIEIQQVGTFPTTVPAPSPISRSFTPLEYRPPVPPRGPTLQIVPEQPKPDVQAIFSRAVVSQVPVFEAPPSVPAIQVLAKYLFRNEGEEEERFKVRRSMTLSLISSPWSLSPDAALKAGYLLAQQLFLGTVYDKEVQQAVEYLRFRLQTS